MAKLNKPIKAEPIFTHGGAKAVPITPIQQLRRSVLSCLLWEGEFYEDGASIAERIKSLAETIDPVEVASLAIEARHKMHLRHVPLLLLAVLTKTGAGRSDGLVRKTIANVISRADELGEFLAVYKAQGGKALSGQVKKGLAQAMLRFDEYALRKYDRDGAFKLRDVAFLSHVKPRDKAQALTIARLVNKDRFPVKTKGGFLVAETLAPESYAKLKPADTWEAKLSAGEGKKSDMDKRAQWSELLKKTASETFVPGSLSYMALIRNLRNFEEVGVSRDLVRKALSRHRGVEKVFPYRFIAAAKHAPIYEAELDKALLASLAKQAKLPGKTLIIGDVSGSMTASMSTNSEMNRMDAMASLAAIARELCEEAVVYATAGNDAYRIHATAMVPPRHGMALIDAIKRMPSSVGNGGIFLTPALRWILAQEKEADRIIVITDEQDCSVADKDKPSMAAPFGKRGNYLLNVGSARNGIGYGKWTHIDGFSANVIRYIREAEGLEVDPILQGQSQQEDE